MLDKQLCILVQNYLATAAPLRGLVNGDYMMRFQPLQQGRPDDRTVYMHKISDRRYGARTVSQRYIAGNIVTRRETQSMETTFQFSVTQPAALQDNELTHGDVLKIIAATLQSDDALRFLIANGASVLRVADIRTIYVTNDRNQHEEQPTFDLVLKHDDVFVDGQPFFNTFNFQALPVPNIA